MSNVLSRVFPYMVTFLRLRYSVIVYVEAVADNQRRYLKMWQVNTDWMISTNQEPTRWRLKGNGFADYKTAIEPAAESS